MFRHLAPMVFIGFIIMGLAVPIQHKLLGWGMDRGVLTATLSCILAFVSLYAVIIALGAFGFLIVWIGVLFSGKEENGNDKK